MGATISGGYIAFEFQVWWVNTIHASLFSSGAVERKKSSPYCSSWMGEGASIMTSRPLLFLGKAMKSRIYHCLGGDWPLKECLVLAEFLEYLKGESHFLALVVEVENK